MYSTYISKLGDSYFPIECKTNQVFNGLFCEDQKILNICSSSTDIVLLEKLEDILSTPRYTCVDFWIYLINSSDVTYRLLDNVNLFYLEFVGGVFKVNGNNLTITSQLTNM